MNNISTQQLILGSGTLTTTGNNLYLNGVIISGGGNGGSSLNDVLFTTGVQEIGNKVFTATGILDDTTAIIFSLGNRFNGATSDFIIHDNGAGSDIFTIRSDNSSPFFIIADNNGNQSADLFARQLSDTDANITLDWEHSQLTDGDFAWQLNGSRILTQSSLKSTLFVEQTLTTNKINFKNTGNYLVTTVPAGNIFLIDTMEIISTNVTSPSQAPFISFGNNPNFSGYNNIVQTTSNSLYSRHILDNPQDGVGSGISLYASVVTASTAAIHSGYLIYKGILIPS